MGRQHLFISRENGLPTTYRPATGGHCPLLT